MTDDKLSAARRAFANIADLVTEALMAPQPQSHNVCPNPWAILVSVREIAQDAAEATFDKVETRT